jgi:RNA polymerase primary sigma factor
VALCLPQNCRIIWRDELNDGKVFLRDIIDLEATYAGPDAKGAPLAPAEGGNGAAPGAVAQPQTVAPATAPAGRDPVPGQAQRCAGRRGAG